MEMVTNCKGEALLKDQIIILKLIIHRTVIVVSMNCNS